MIVLWARSFRTATAIGWVWPDAAAIGVIFSRGELIVSRAPSLEHGGHRHAQSGWTFDTWPAPLSVHPFSGGWRDWPIRGRGPMPGPLEKVVITEQWSATWSQPASRTEWTVGGFSYALNLQVYPDQTATVFSRRLLVPRWFVVVVIALFAALPVICVRSYRRGRRARREGHCRVCHYDLRATPRRCPECGAVAE
jgi:hypothetical protein